MIQRAIRRVLVIFALALISITIALAQSSNSTFEIPVTSTRNTWSAAQAAAPTKGKLIVVTLDQPNRRQSCQVKSFTLDRLVCSRAIGGPRTYRPEQIAAIILPGDENLRARFFLGANSVLGASIWGTVVLAATCPVCAVATGIVALVAFSFAGAVAYTDDQPDSLLYLAPGQELSHKLGYIKS